jgi:hypothetical protein
MITPMDFPAYFRSPIETLSDSLTYGSSVSLHDLTDAYSTLSMRIRSQSGTIVHVDKNHIALRPLKLFSGELYQCLRRDIRIALDDPFSNTEDFMTPKLLDVETDNVKYARDVLALSLHSLRFISDLFRFQALHSMFSSELLDRCFSYWKVDPFSR